MNFALLNAEILANATLTDAELLLHLNEVNITAVQDIRTVDIKQYLIVTGKILAINASTEPAALLTVEALKEFDSFDMSDQANVAALNAQMDGLIAAGLLVAGDKAFILAMGEKTISRSMQIGLGAVTMGDVTAARRLK